MPTGRKQPYAPLPAHFPAVLAPASPLPDSFTSTTDALAARLAQADAPRRQTGARHAAPPALGLPGLVCTAFRGEWSKDEGPSWVRKGRSEAEERAAGEEERAWAGLGVQGIPRDEAQFEEWEQVKREWRARRAKRPTAPQKDVQEETQVSVKTQGKGRTTSTLRMQKQPVLSSLFTSSKPSVSAAASSSASKKRPPSSPPSHPPPLGPTKPALSKRKDDASSASFPSLSSINSAGRRRQSSSSRAEASAHTRAAEGETEETEPLDGETEEVLFEGGCTQMLLPDPTPSASAHLPCSRLPSHPSAARPSAPTKPREPFSSPGLHHPCAPAALAVSTPYQHAARRRRSASYATDSSPPPPPPAAAAARPPLSRAQTQLSTASGTSTLAVGGAGAGSRSRRASVEPKGQHRLSSLGQTQGGGRGQGESVEGSAGGESWEGFLEEDARD